MTPTQKRIAALIGLTLVGFGGLCGALIEGVTLRPYACLEGNIVAVQGEIGAMK